MILYFAIIVNLLLAFKLYWDWRAKNVKHRIINHEQSAIIDLLIYTASAWFLIGFPSASGWIILAVGYKWLVFDPIYSKINWGVWDFHGNSSNIDVWLKQVGPWHPIVKLIPIAIGIALIIIV